MEKKSLHEVQEFNEQKFTKRVVFQQGESVIFVLNFMPGQALPSHKHPGAAVTLLVLEGAGTAIVDGSSTEVTQGDVIRVEGEETFSFTNSADRRTSLYVFLDKIPDSNYAKNV